MGQLLFDHNFTSNETEKKVNQNQLQPDKSENEGNAINEDSSR